MDPVTMGRKKRMPGGLQTRDNLLNWEAENALFDQLYLYQTCKMIPVPAQYYIFQAQLRFITAKPVGYIGTAHNKQAATRIVRHDGVLAGVHL